MFQSYLPVGLVFCRIMYREMKDSDKEKESGKMVNIDFFHLLPNPFTLGCEFSVAVLNVLMLLSDRPRPH